MPSDTQKEIEKLKKDLQSLYDEFYRNNFISSQDFQKYSRFNSRLKVPTYATAPSVCEVGEIYCNTANGKYYGCTAANTWTVLGTQS